MVNELDIIQVLSFKEEAFYYPNQGVPPGLPKGYIKTINDKKFVFIDDYGFPFDYVDDFKIIGRK